MPSINILEQDLTKGGEASTNYNVVYVPGYMSTTNGGTASAETPILCSSIAEFEEYFGTEPYKFDPSNLEDKKPDKSYLYAKELISLGLPVLYESVNAKDTTNVSEGLLLSKITTGLFDKLVDKGEYQFKFLTSGGYPLFSVATSNSEESTTTDTTKSPTVSITEENFPVEISDSTAKTYKFRLTSNSEWEMFEVTTTTEEEDSLDKAFKGTTIDDDTYVISKNETDDGVLQSKVFLTVTMNDHTLSVGDAIKVEFSTSDTTDCTFVPLTVKASSDAYKKATAVAESRGDCIVLIDHTKVTSATKLNEMYKSLCIAADELTNTVADQCAALTPWVKVACPTYVATDNEDTQFSMPPSFAYLTAYANSLKSNPSWLAIAGAARGQIPNFKGLDLDDTLSNSLAESFQNRGEDTSTGVSINAITNIKPFGYRIWGNRTLKNNKLEKGLTATSFLNTRNMICDVKKVVYEACRRYTFEQNNDVLWLNFKAYIEPTLNQMKAGAGLSGYKIVKVPTTAKAKLCAQIKLYPLYAVEDFEITVQMLDDEIKVS